MTVDDIKISKAFLEGGDDLFLNEHVAVKHPTIGEILKLGYGIYCDDYYWNYVFALINDPYDNMVWLDDLGIDYESVCAFDVMLLKWKHLEDTYQNKKEYFDKAHFHPLSEIIDALNFFIIGDHVYKIGEYQDGNKCLYDIAGAEAVIDTNNPNNYLKIDKSVFNYISSFLKMINGIDRKDKIQPANKSAKKILIEDMRDEQKRQQKNKKEDNDCLGNMMAGATHGGNGGITSLNVKQHKIYQIYSALSVTQKKLHFNHVMGGVYAGNVNSEKLNTQELNWMG